MDWPLFFSASLLFVAFCYSVVGHGGASGYLAMMALWGISFSEMRPAALILNLFVSGISWWQFARIGAFSSKLLIPFVLASVPAAFVGGGIAVDVDILKVLLGSALLMAAFNMFAKNRPQRKGLVSFPSTWQSFPLGGLLGFVSGIVGVGGGIFLSPVLLIFRWGDARLVAGVSAAFIFLNSFAGLFGYLASGGEIPNRLPQWIFCVFIGGFLGSYLGAHYLPIVWLRRVLGILLLLASQKMFWF